MRYKSLNPHSLRHWPVRAIVLLLLLALCRNSSWAQETQFDAAAEARLIAAMLGETPILSDLQILTDEIGGRASGSTANLKAVEWALERFRSAGLTAQKEAFTMPALWLEKNSSVLVSGDVEFSPRVVAMPFSSATAPKGMVAPLVDGGRGQAEDFERLGNSAAGAWVVIETEVLEDLAGLFREYEEAPGIESRAFAAGAAGMIYMSSRPMGLLYRHNASLGVRNTHPMLIMEREAAQRVLRLLRRGKRLSATVRIELQTGPAYQSYNVVAEIPGREKPGEFVLIGAHIDSWDLGTGANDNGCNAALVIDLARQFQRLGIHPRRTLRFALFNGEEQGLYGSLGYTRTHAAELDGHVLAVSVDIGSGRITGFFTGGNPALLTAVQSSLQPVQGMGPFTQIDAPIVGTDNYDFMMQGVANLVANQADANYGPTYHARSDTYDKVDEAQLKLNSAIMAAVIYRFAEMEVSWKRQSRAELEALIEATDLGQQMRSFGVWEDWENGSRGRSK